MLAYIIPGVAAFAVILGLVVEGKVNSSKHKAEQQRRQQHFGRYWQ